MHITHEYVHGWGHDEGECECVWVCVCVCVGERGIHWTASAPLWHRTASTADLPSSWPLTSQSLPSGWPTAGKIKNTTWNNTLLRPYKELDVSRGWRCGCGRRRCGYLRYSFWILSFLGGASRWPLTSERWHDSRWEGVSVISCRLGDGARVYYFTCESKRDSMYKHVSYFVLKSLLCRVPLNSVTVCYKCRCLGWVSQALYSAPG